MEREVGGGIRMGNTCKPMAVSFQCMTESTKIKKKKNQEISKYSDSQFLCVKNSDDLKSQFLHGILTF